MDEKTKALLNKYKPYMIIVLIWAIIALILNSSYGDMFASRSIHISDAEPVILTACIINNLILLVLLYFVYKIYKLLSEQFK